ncbi:hypothetical protein D3C87_2001390 [compost metagenome]
MADSPAMPAGYRSAAGYSTLHSRTRHTFNDVFLSNQEDNNHRNNSRGGSGHHAVVVHVVLQNEVLQTQRYGEQVMID